jgi:hypothetical protein
VALDTRRSPRLRRRGLKRNVLQARLAPAFREATALAAAPVHRVRGTDPNWRFAEIVAEERRRGAHGSTFSCWPRTTTRTTARLPSGTTSCGRVSSRPCSR